MMSLVLNCVTRSLLDRIDEALTLGRFFDRQIEYALILDLEEPYKVLWN